MKKGLAPKPRFSLLAILAVFDKPGYLALACLRRGGPLWPPAACVSGAGRRTRPAPTGPA